MKENINDFRECLALNRLAFDTVKSSFRRGMSEKDVKELITGAWRKKLGFDPPFSGDIVGGADRERIDGGPTDRVLKDGDTLILDLQPTYNGMFADTTRTFFIGEPSEEIKRVYAALRLALSRTEKLLRAGVRANEIYRGLQASLSESGLFCPHHAGHRVGAKKLMEPEFLEDESAPVEEGTFAAIEPGFYTESFGIRIENNYLVTSAGAEELFCYPLETEYFII